MPLGSQIKKYREAAGCTFAEVEAMSGVSTGNINALEKRNSNRSEHTQALARAFGLTTDQLLDESADFSDHVRTHVARWRQSKVMPGDQLRASDNLAAYATTYWPFALSQERVKAALSQDDIRLVDAYILALVQTREDEQGKPAARQQGNGRP